MSSLQAEILMQHVSNTKQHLPYNGRLVSAVNKHQG